MYHNASEKERARLVCSVHVCTRASPSMQTKHSMHGALKVALNPKTTTV